MFLSHSHADKNKALEVKNYLESETNHKVFVDSLFWDYKDDVLSKKNKALEVKNYLESETNHKVFVDSLFWDYKDDVLSKLAEYDGISGIGDAFTLILRESLEYVIKKCPYFVFLQSNNSVSFNQDLSRITYSAWIYEELRIAHSISSESRLTIMMESFQVSHNISLFLEHLETITLRKLSHIINS